MENSVQILYKRCSILYDHCSIFFQSLISAGSNLCILIAMFVDVRWALYSWSVSGSYAALCTRPVVWCICSWTVVRPRTILRPWSVFWCSPWAALPCCVTWTIIWAVLSARQHTHVPATVLPPSGKSTDQLICELFFI